MPEVGRFSGADPIGDQYPHVSVYNYAENEPIGSIDLWGLQRVNVMQPDKNGIVAPTHTLGSTVYQGRNVTRPPQFNGSQPSIGPAPQNSLDPVASTIGHQLVTSAPMIVEDVAGTPFAAFKGVVDVYHGDYVGATLEAAGIILPGVTGKALKKMNFDQARKSAFDFAGMKNGKVEFSKMDPKTGTVVEFKGEGGAKVGYDGPHSSPGPFHDQQHISAQSAGKRKEGGTKRANFPYEGSRHPSRSDKKQ